MPLHSKLSRPHDKHNLATLVCRGIHLENPQHQSPHHWCVVGSTYKTRSISRHIISSCFFKLFMDLVICMIHIVNILNNKCSFLLPTYGCYGPSPLGTSSASRLTSLPRALPITLPKARPELLVLTIICTLKES